MIEVICYVILACAMVQTSTILTLVAIVWNELRKSESGNDGAKT